jgi:hypothetical protein
MGCCNFCANRYSWHSERPQHSLFNTASVFAMTKHFKEDKDFIYGLDIHHLDANRAAKINR